MKADAEIPDGPIEMSFGGVRNPRSFEPTDIIKLASYDNQNNDVGAGAVDNIQMSKPG